MFWKPLSKRPPSGEYNIKRDHKELDFGNMDWIELEQDRVKWLAVALGVFVF